MWVHLTPCGSAPASLCHPDDPVIFSLAFWCLFPEFSGTGALAIFLHKSFQLDITTSDYDDAEIEENIAHNCQINDVTPVLPHIKRKISCTLSSFDKLNIMYLIAPFYIEELLYIDSLCFQIPGEMPFPYLIHVGTWLLQVIFCCVSTHFRSAFPHWINIPHWI